jgi:hypothetical protein
MKKLVTMFSGSQNPERCEMVNKKKEFFAITFFKNCAWHGKRYSVMSMEKARYLCKKWYHVDISERSASRYMHELKEEKIFERQRRAPRRERGQLKARSSLTYLKEGVFKMMGKFRPLVDVLNRLADAPKVAYNLLKRRDKHHPFVDKQGDDGLVSVKRMDAAVFRTA